jgi:hypothetical protein
MEVNHLKGKVQPIKSEVMEPSANFPVHKSGKVETAERGYETTTSVLMTPPITIGGKTVSLTLGAQTSIPSKLTVVSNEKLEKAFD